MSEIDYNTFKLRLTTTQKEILEEIHKNLYEINRKNIAEGILLDKKHLNLINFCANFFVPSGQIHNQFGYNILTVEPLTGTGLKNFDLAIYNKEKKRLILVECKTSISNINDELADLKKAIKQTFDNLPLLKRTIGEVNKIEFAISADGNIAKDLVDKICEKNIPVCTWSCSQTRNELKLFKCSKEDHGTAIKNGRVHQDEDFNKFLYEGTQIQGNLPMYPIIPSSNMCNILIHANMNIKRLQGSGNLEDIFDYAHLLYIIEKELKSTTLNQEQIEVIVENLLKKALEKEIYSDELKEEKILKNKKFKIKMIKQTPKKIMDNTKENYINKNADKRAKKEAIIEMGKKGVPVLDNFLKR